MIRFAQSSHYPTAAELWTFLICVLFIVGGVALYYRIKSDRRKANESDEPKRRLLPSPLITREEDPPVLISAFIAQNQKRDQELREMETRLEKRIDTHERLVRGRLHDLSGEVNNVALEAKNGREIATAQFKNIEGRLGELKATTEHTNALAIRTDQALREIPEKIATAVARNTRK